MLIVDIVNSISQLWIIVRKLSFSSGVNLTSIKNCFNLVLILSRLRYSAQGRRGSYFQPQAPYLSLVNATVGFSENLFLVDFFADLYFFQMPLEATVLRISGEHLAPTLGVSSRGLVWVHRIHNYILVII